MLNLKKPKQKHLKRLSFLFGASAVLLGGMAVDSHVDISAEGDYDKSYNYQNVLSTAFTDMYLNIRNNDGKAENPDGTSTNSGVSSGGASAGVSTSGGSGSKNVTTDADKVTTKNSGSTKKSSSGSSSNDALSNPIGDSAKDYLGLNNTGRLPSILVDYVLDAFTVEVSADTESETDTEKDTEEDTDTKTKTEKKSDPDFKMTEAMLMQRVAAVAEHGNFGTIGMFYGANESTIQQIVAQLNNVNGASKDKVKKLDSMMGTNYVTQYAMFGSGINNLTKASRKISNITSEYNLDTFTEISTKFTNAGVKILKRFNPAPVILGFYDSAKLDDANNSDNELISLVNDNDTIRGFIKLFGDQTSLGVSRGFMIMAVVGLATILVSAGLQVFNNNAMMGKLTVYGNIETI